VDLSTGSVAQVTVRKSTGYKTLDAAAVRALKRWRFKPGSWKTLDIPLDFKMGRSHEDYLEKVHKAQQQERQL
jgi:outer membrane biosynthesis protein TonB